MNKRNLSNYIYFIDDLICSLDLSIKDESKMKLLALNLVDSALEEQKQICADATVKELKAIGFQLYDIGEARIRRACLDATGESDENQH